MPRFTFEPLGPHHDRAAFSCGNASLDDFIKTKARKENELGYCAVFIMANKDTPTVIAGYYTLSAHSIRIDGIDAQRRKKFPKYPIVPTTLLGRLARDVSVKGINAGALLLMDALHRAWASSAQVGSHAVVVDAIDDRAADFYQRFGFVQVLEETRRFYLPIVSIRELVGN